MNENITSSDTAADKNAAVEQLSDQDNNDERVDLSGTTDCYIMERIDLPDDVNFIYSIENVSSSEIRIFYDKDGSGIKEYITDHDVSNFSFVDREIPQECSNADYYCPANDMRSYSDGSIIYLLEDHGGIKAPEKYDEYDENFDHDSYIKNCKTSFIIADYKDGKVVRTIPFEFPDGTEYALNVSRIVDFEDYFLYTKLPGELFRINKEDGSVDRISDITEGLDPELLAQNCFSASVIKDRDGEPYVVYTEIPNVQDAEYKVCKVNDDGLSDALFSYSNDYDQPVPGYGKYKFLVYGKNTICGICDDGSEEVLIDLEKSGLPDMQICPLGYGDFLGYYNENHIHEDTEYVPFLLRLTPAADSQQ